MPAIELHSPFRFVTRSGKEECGRDGCSFLPPPRFEESERGAGAAEPEITIIGSQACKQAKATAGREEKGGGSSIQSFHASKDNGGAGSGSLGREGMPTQIAEKNQNVANADLRVNYAIQEDDLLDSIQEQRWLSGAVDCR